MSEEEKQYFIQSEALKRMSSSDKKQLILEWSLGGSEAPVNISKMSNYMEKFVYHFLEEKKNLEETEIQIIQNVMEILRE